MTRNYRMMREVLLMVGQSDAELDFMSFLGVQPRGELVAELKRASREGLIDSGLRFDGDVCHGGTVRGLTDEGRAFCRDIESDDVWAIIVSTLDEAGVDLSYPLLKEVCEEIVKRYVISFIPDITHR